MEFKENFLWGVATAANQCEGGYLEGGKGLTIQDNIKGGGIGRPRMFRSTMEEGAFYPSHDAVDYYHHYEEDIRLLAEMGCKMLSHEYQLGKNFSNRMRRGAKSGRTFLL